MARSEPPHGFEPSLFDKLFADAPLSPARRRMSLDELKDSVARDLEALLNARTTLEPMLEGRFPQSLASVLSFGLDDFAGLSLASVHDRTRICRSIAAAIARHEPRLREVQVTLELDRRSINALHFSIRAMLVVKPAQEPVSFDALLQPTTLQYSVARRGREQFA